MAKIIVAIEDRLLKEMTKAQLQEELELFKKDYFPVKDRSNMISLDEAHMTRDPSDDSFYIFEFRGVEES